MTTSAEQSERVEEVIRLPSELPRGWEKSSLAEVAEIIMGQSPSSEYYNTEGSGLPFFQGKAEFADLYPEAVKWCSVPGKIAQKDDVLISVRAPVGPTNLAPSECCIGRGLAAIRPRNGIPPKYILHYLRSIERDIDSLGTGTTFKAISGKTLREIPIPVAPPDQQKRIVAEIEKQFSRLDEAVANLKRVKANLKRYKAAVLKAAVEGRLVETEAELARREGRSCETGAQLLQRILETRRSQWQGKGKYKEPAAPVTTDLPELPEGWVWAAVDQTAQIISGLTKNPKREARPRKFPYLRVANVYANELRLDEIEHIGVADSELEKLLLQRDDLLVVEGNGSPDQIGRVALWDGSIPNCVHQNHIIKVRFSDTSLPKWAMNWLLSPRGRDHIEQVSSSTSGLHTLSTGKVSRLPVPIPPLAEQHRIVAEVDRRLSRLRETEAQVDANLQRAERLRQATLASSFARPGGI